MKRNEIKRMLPRALAVLMSLTILCSGVGVVSYAAGSKQNETSASEEKTKTESDVEEEENKKDEKASKTETVYVIAKADGTPDKVIVSEWIKNPEKLSVLNDKSGLKDIENVKGDETFTVDENGMYEWKADGSDIYYQGTSDSELPVGVSVSFTLDGKKISPDDLAGKSGRVEMKFTYTNRLSEEVKINGKKEKIYVPFVMLTGMLLDNENFTNVDVTNGKVVNDGSHTYVAGFALPGMQETLGIDKEDFELPSSFTVTADVSDFELATTLTVATTELFGDVDTDELDKKLDELDKKIDSLTEAVDKLCDGTSALYEGIGTLLSKSGDLIDGVAQLRDGAEQLKSGTAQLKDGTSQLAQGAGELSGGAAQISGGASQLDSGAGALSSGAQSVDDGASSLQGYIAQLSGGLNQLSSNSKPLNSGAKQVFDTLLATADAQIAAAGLTAEKLTVENYSAVLSGLINQLSEENVRQLAYNTALETVSATVNSQRDVVRQAVEAEVKKQVTEGVLAAAGYPMTAENYEAAVAAQQIPAEVQTQIAAAVSAQMAQMSGTVDSTTEAKLKSVIDENMQSEEVQAQIAAAVEKAAAGKQSLISLSGQLDSYNQFYQGVLSYTAGVDSANAGAVQLLNGAYSLKNGTQQLRQGASDLKSGTSSLSSGTKQLSGGAAELKSGASKLSDGAAVVDSGAAALFSGLDALSTGANALVDGVRQLNDGSMQLDEGMKQFREEGIKKLTDAVNSDLRPVADRFKAAVELSKKYKSFGGISEDMDGKTDFIFKTDSISTDND